MSTKNQHIKLGNISIEVIRKSIKNIVLSVHPPNGRVTMSAPTRMSLDALRVYALSRLEWIHKRQCKMRTQSRETKRDLVPRESHYYLGKRYLLRVVEENAPQRVIIKHSALELHVRPGATREDREAVLHAWYRKQLKEIIPTYIAKWEKKLGVKVAEFGVKKMKTKWGACNPTARRIWVNLELAKKPLESIEYIVFHEMVHLLERKHSIRFIAHMDKHMPQWRGLKDTLNQSMLGHVEWACT